MLVSSSIGRDVRAIEYQKARHLMQAGRYDLAIEAMGRLLAQFPEESRALVIVAQSYMATERQGEALAAIQQALRLDGNNCFAHALAGYVLSSLGRFDQAARECETALRIDPESSIAHCWYSMHLRSLGLQPAKALKHAQKAVELEPQRSALHQELGKAFRAAQRVDEAERAFRTSLRLNPQNADALYDLGCLLLDERHDLTQARFCLSQAVQLAPDDRDIRKVAERILTEQQSGGRLFWFWYRYRFHVMRRRRWIRPFVVAWGVVGFASVATANVVGCCATYGIMLVLPLLDAAVEQLMRPLGRRIVSGNHGRHARVADELGGEQGWTATTR